MANGVKFLLLYHLLSINNLLAGANIHSHVDINLDDGVVTGYSERVRFISTPSIEDNRGKCGRQAVIVIQLGGEAKLAHFHLKFNNPRLWTFHLSDTLKAEGYGFYTTVGNESAIEMQVLNQQMRMYSAWPPPGSSAVSDEPGGHLSQWMYLRVIDDTVDKSNVVELTLSLQANTVRWHDERLAHDYSAPPGLFYHNGVMKDNVTLFVAMNRIISENWRAGSGLCHVGIKLMENEEQCNAVDNGCDPNASCKPTRKGFLCLCKKGWQGNGKQCQDVNECLPQNGGCVHTCHNTPGSYRCLCHPGFTNDPSDHHNCIDIDECSINNGGCEQECINTIGSYDCKCFKNGITFTTNEKHCRGGNPLCYGFGCQPSCEIIYNKHLKNCPCLPGYQPITNGKSCQKSCNIGNGGCHHHCHDTSSGPVCSCHHKYLLGLDNHSCAASCYVNNGGCHKRCLDNNVVVTCSCPNGYLLKRDGKTCDDIDECTTGEDGCQHQCVNSIGGYECLCPSGYKLNPIDERSCIDIDECELNDTCEHICINTLGSYQCQCKSGYQLFGKTHCGDIDECSESNGGCSNVCVNIEGSFYCSNHPIVNKYETTQRECIAAYFANIKFHVSGIPESQKKLYGQSISKKLQESVKDCIIQYNKMQPVNTRKRSSNFAQSDGKVFQVHMEIMCKSYNNTVTCAQNCNPEETKEALCRTIAQLKENTNRDHHIIIQDDTLSIVAKSLVFKHFHSKSCDEKGERKRVQDLCSNSQRWKIENNKKTSASDQSIELQTILRTKLSNIDSCPSGSFWNSSASFCQLCPKDYYQDRGKQKSCKKCPVNSFTDSLGSTKLDDCKRTKCQSYINELSGFIESPNFPGDYPNNADCTWILKPPKRRRLLIILSELNLAGDKCQDFLMMRKSKNPLSPVTFEACRSITKPMAFVAQSRTLWIQFQSDSHNNSKGFHISFVTYNEEYQNLIEDIVQDSRLYASPNHLEILQDKKILRALMEVIAQPINYYKYESEKRKMLPSSFIRFMTPKVRKFFSYR